MSVYPSQIGHEPTLTLYSGQEEQRPETGVEQYVDVWLLLEVTAEDEAGEPVQAKLIATTTNPMTAAFQQLWRTYAERGILTLFLYSRYAGRSHTWWPMPREWAAFRPHALPIITVRRDPWAVRALADTGAQISLVHPRLVLSNGVAHAGRGSPGGARNSWTPRPSGASGRLAWGSER